MNTVTIFAIKMCSTAVLLSAMLLTNSAAQALTKKQEQVVGAIALAHFAGDASLDNCPRYRLNIRAVYDELASVGLSGRDFKNPDFERVREDTVKTLAREYVADASKVCSSAWKLFGPAGDYKRQMLEAK